MKVIYDIEIYKNLFLVVFYDLETKKFITFQISPFLDQRYELFTFLGKLELMIGFNNLGFDYPLIELFIIQMNKSSDVPAHVLVTMLKNKADQIINSKSRFNYTTKFPAIKQLDLFKIYHFDNLAKSTSLKALEFVLRMNEIEELPYPPDSILTRDQIVNVLLYCVKDVKTTLALYERNETTDAITLRIELSQQYEMDMMNMNDPKIGEIILLQAVKKATGKEVLGKTYREQIIVNDILFPYIVFYTPEFKAIHNWFKSKIIKQIKGVFSNLPIEQVESLKPYVNLEKSMLKAKGTILKTLNVIYNDFQFDFGVGGIHGSVDAGVYNETRNYAILDIDVSSFYPNESIQNRYYPEHLSELFCDVYENMYHDRKKFPKGSAKNKALKLGLNGAYGKSNSEYSELYDPQYTMTTTINGQLSLCMLAEMLSFVPNLKMLQANTDGITVLIPKIYLPVAKLICEKWEATTKLDLEYARYSKMIIRDVNNYLAVFRDTGKVKSKGAFDYANKEIHQDHSMLIVPKAVEAYFTKKIPVKDFIMNHADKWDFFKRVKLNNDSKLISRTEDGDFRVQNLTRYYVAKKGTTLIKVMPPLKDKIKERETNIESGYLCAVANNVTDEVLIEMDKNIDYSYYINECNKIINVIEHGN